MNASSSFFRSVASALVALALACEPHSSGMRPAASGALNAPSASVLAPAGAPPAASGEPTCACAKNGAASGSKSAAAISPAGPTIAYNGPLAGDVSPSMVEARIRDAGGVPLRLTPQNQHLLASAHALVLVGGDDIDPKRYGERVHGKVHLLSPDREVFDFQLIEAATNLRLPVLGICLGAQELWVAAKGTLIQDIPSEVGSKVNHRAKEALHPISLLAGTKLAAIYGTKPLNVFSNHHQAVDAKGYVPKGFVVSAMSGDGVAEAFESEASNPAFIVGVGWHPEKRDQERVLFEGLITRAKAVQHSTPPLAH